MPRKRSGTLVLKTSGWYARIPVDTEIGVHRQWVALNTLDEDEARRRMAEMIASAEPRPRSKSAEDTLRDGLRRVAFKHAQMVGACNVVWALYELAAELEPWREGKGAA